MENHTGTQQNYNQSKEQLSLLQTIAMEVAAADHFSSALEVVLRRVCEKTGWVLGQAWVPNDDGTALDCGSAWFCGNGELRDFRAASEASHFRPGVGLPGRVWESKQPAWIEDVRNDPNFPRTVTAKTIGLKTAVGIPILSGEKVIAVIEFFMRESRSKSEQLVKVIAAIAAQLNLVMERKEQKKNSLGLTKSSGPFCLTWAMQLSSLTRMANFLFSTRWLSASSDRERSKLRPTSGRATTDSIYPIRSHFFRPMSCR